MSDLSTAISGPMVQEYKNISSLKVSRVSVQPENKTSLTLAEGNTSDLYISIPSRPNSFLNGKNTYLSFTWKPHNCHSDTIKVQLANGTGGSFIRNLETIAGSTSLELIQNYDVLSSLVDDFQSQTRCNTLGNILEDSSVPGQAATTPFAPTSNAKRGMAHAYNDANPTRICIPLMSLAVGVLQDKYMPMGTDFGLRLRLTMNDPKYALVAQVAGALGYTLEDITLECEYLDSDPATYNQIVEAGGGVMKVSGTGISNFQNTIAASIAATTNTTLIPARFSSVRNYLTSFRENSNLTSQTGNSPGHRTRANIENWVYRIHGRNYPNLPVVADAWKSAESMCEALKCFHALHDTQTNVVFDATEYCASGPAGTGTVESAGFTGSFVIGNDFEESSFSSSQLSGMDTNSSNTFLETYHSGGYYSLNVDTFCFFDSIIEMNVQTGEVMVSK